MMQRAKAFLYVSLGILAVAGAFHLGARSARGQSGVVQVGGVAGRSASGFVAAAVGQDGNLWAKKADTSDPGTAGPIPPPKAGQIVAVEAESENVDNRAIIAVLYDDGDIFHYYYGGLSPGWEYIGNIFAAPVQAQATTWGRVKAERR